MNNMMNILISILKAAKMKLIGKGPFALAINAVLVEHLSLQTEFHKQLIKSSEHRCSIWQDGYAEGIAHAKREIDQRLCRLEDIALNEKSTGSTTTRDDAEQLRFAIMRPVVRPGKGWNTRINGEQYKWEPYDAYKLKIKS